MKNGLNKGIPNDLYHSKNGRLSSSNLKTILKSPKKFHREYMLGKEPPKTATQKAAMTIGNAYHTLVLEPHLFDEEYAVFNGRRSGDKYNKFLGDNFGKTILNKTEHEVAIKLRDATLNSTLASSLLSGGEAELSIGATLDDLDIKVRPDYFAERKEHANFIVDLKSTRVELDEEVLRAEISRSHYDLSAALYLDACRIANIAVEDFYWIFASKASFEVQVVKMSDQQYLVGREKYTKAIEIHKEHEAKGWKFVEEIMEVEPSDYDVAKWLTKDEPEELFV
jgi:hypothetical protein